MDDEIVGELNDWGGPTDWCEGCDKLRCRNTMRWLTGLYLCVECLGPGVGTPALWIDPWSEQIDAELPPYPWGSWAMFWAAMLDSVTVVLVVVALVFALSGQG